MQMQSPYPWSRIGTRNCPHCKGSDGQLAARAPIVVTRAEDEAVELLRVTCAKCGYTMLFDLDVYRTTPYTGTVEETPPSFE